MGRTAWDWSLHGSRGGEWEDLNIRQLFRIQSFEYYSRGIWNKEKRTLESIENGLHRILDLGFREDESRIRKGNAAENMNIVRHLGLNLLKQEKSCRMGTASKRKNVHMTGSIY